MRDASMQSENQQLVTRNEVPEDIGIREDRADHERPSEDSPAVHRVRSKHVLAAEHGFSDQSASDAMSDRIHYSSLSDARTCLLRSEEHTSELQSHLNLVCRLLLEK